MRRVAFAVGAGYNPAMARKKPPLRIQPTTLWDYPSQHYGEELQGDPNYRGATPSYVVWNLLRRYTDKGDLVVDPCVGSGTTLDVATELGRRAIGYDVNPTRDDVTYCDARTLPLKSDSVDFVFLDPPYSTHLEYSDDPACIGKLSAADGDYYEAMELVLHECARILRPDHYMAVYVSDSYEHGKAFHPIGFTLFEMLARRLSPVDIVAVTRHNRTLTMGNYRKSAEEGNFYLRGFNYLLIFYKPGRFPTAAVANKTKDKPVKVDRRPMHKRRGKGGTSGKSGRTPGRGRSASKPRRGRRG